MAFALGTSASHNRPIRDGRAVTVNLNECVIVTTGTLATTSVTYNKHNSCTPEFGPHIRSNTVDKKKGEETLSRTSTRNLLNHIWVSYHLHIHILCVTHVVTDSMTAWLHIWHDVIQTHNDICIQTWNLTFAEGSMKVMWSSPTMMFKMSKSWLRKNLTKSTELPGELESMERSFFSNWLDTWKFY